MEGRWGGHVFKGNSEERRSDKHIFLEKNSTKKVGAHTVLIKTKLEASRGGHI